MSVLVPVEYNNSKRVYKVGGNFPNNMTGTGTGGNTSVILETNNNEKNSAKKIRRAFSMTRKPFRWSRKYKTNDECSIKNIEKSNNSSNDDKSIPLSLRREDTDINTLEQQNDNQKYNSNNRSSSINNNINNNSNTTPNNKVLRRSSFRKFLSRVAQHVTSVSIGVNKHSSLTSTNNNVVSDRVPPIGGYQWPPDQTPGVTGLKNHGNTCFMNAVLQCLSHTDILAEYFVLDQYKADLKRRNKLNSKKFGTKGELTEQLANVLKALWTCKNESDHSTSFKAVVDRYGSQFQNSTQHDAQEFLFWLLDKVHEDLNTATKRRYKTIKNSYGRPDEVIAAETLANHIRCNNSFVQAVFQAQFRSSLTCPRCHKQSNTFDPFHCISVQLPQLSQQIIFVTVVYVTQHPRQVKLGLTVPPGSPIIALREQLNADTGIQSNRMVLADINENGFSRVFYDSQPISTLNGINSIYCIEIPEIKDETSSSELMLLIANVKKIENGNINRFGTPFCVQVNRDCSYVELQKKLLKEMSTILKPEVFAYKTPLTDMFEIRLQDPSADPDTYLEQVEHPLLTEIIDMALSVLSSDAGPPHIKLLLEWHNPEEFFLDLSDSVVEHESVSLLKDSTVKHAPLTLEQCLEHYTKAETLSAEDAWRCPNCQQYLPVVKTLGLWSLPDILVIHFKRFRQQNEKGPDAAKLTTMVKFPLNAFDMSPHLARESTSTDSINNVDLNNACGSNSSTGGGGGGGVAGVVGIRHLGGSPWRKPKDHNKYKEKDKGDPKDNRYDLYAVCYHQGETLETGHYTAACKNPYDHQWYKFDDQRVTHVPTDQVQEQIVNNEAYILFYQRRKIDNLECSGTSSTSGDHWVSRIAAPPHTPSININSNTNNGLAVTTTTAASTLDSSNDNFEEITEIKIDENNKKKIKETRKISDNNLQQKSIDEMFHEKHSKSQPQLQKFTEAIFIEKTDENDVIDVESIENDNDNDDDYDIKNKNININNTTIINIKNNNHNIEKIKSTTIKNTTHTPNKLKLINDDIDNKYQKNMNKDISILSNNYEFKQQQIKNKNQQYENDDVQQIEEKLKERNNEINNTNLIKMWPKKQSLTDNDDNNKLNDLTKNNCSVTSENKTDNTVMMIHNHHHNNHHHHHHHHNHNRHHNKNKNIENNYIYDIDTDDSSNIDVNNDDIVPISTAKIINNKRKNDNNIDDNELTMINNATGGVGMVQHNINSNNNNNNNNNNNVKLSHSFSTSSSYKLRETCDTLSMLRNSSNSCSKDTLIYIDQQNHHHSLIEEDDSFLEGRSIWISPVTPHKLITVSPKN